MTYHTTLELQIPIPEGILPDLFIFRNPSGTIIYETKNAEEAVEFMSLVFLGEDVGKYRATKLSRANNFAQIIEMVEKLKISHFGCEDHWYNCPKDPEGCSNESSGDECNCGADKHNDRVAAVIELLKGM